MAATASDIARLFASETRIPGVVSPLKFRLFKNAGKFRVIVMLFGVASVWFAASVISEQNMCAECDALREKLRIIETKVAALEDGLQMARRARAEFESNSIKADAFASAYVILQSVNISLGIATLPCSIPKQWLKGIFASSGAASAALHGDSASGATLSAGLGYLGLGVIGDTLSAVEFLREWAKSGKDVKEIGDLMDRQIDDFLKMKHRLKTEQESLEIDYSNGGCEDDDSLDWLLQ